MVLQLVVHLNLPVVVKRIRMKHFSLINNILVLKMKLIPVR
ncbi:hypothetical protein BLA29_011088 [Euroglyphus maynei]|uniref:Uncharacterized protein n=1 Tax=Euroglyphus maynei TaxID=6958 RepID=A0A1Y3ASD5_EURMA|nr:hypothetical protein BLA29_011088 [Euroglyphus maynei]